ncbi:MAG: HAD family hydrolase [Candidatus Kerfeldbacteria bacterium]|nr:HAD family hydrolase [Candidatus Kerfeldbacteria bacterium]
MGTSCPVPRPWTIIFDGDDTLWLCGEFYRQAEAGCIDLLKSIQFEGTLDKVTLVALQRKIQRALMRRHGFYLTIFEDAWSETYRQLCDRQGQRFDRGVDRELQQMSGAIHAAAYPIFPGVLAMLAELREQGHILHLVTLGDETFQRSKVQRNGLEAAFSQAHVVQHGKGTIMYHLASGQQTMMVGDSLPSDIQPAKRLSIQPVWIDHSNDEWHIGDGSQDLKGVHVIDRVTELPKLIARLDG